MLDYWTKYVGVKRYHRADKIVIVRLGTSCSDEELSRIRADAKSRFGLVLPEWADNVAMWNGDAGTFVLRYSI